MPPSTDKPLTFPIRLRINGRPEIAQIRFAGDADVKWMLEWQTSGHETDSPNKEVEDTLEYAALTFKFHSLYKRSQNLIQSPEELYRIAKRELRLGREAKHNDLFFTLVLEKAGIAYGYAAMRRTWKNTLKLEYLFKSPQILRSKDEIKWIGSNLLFFSVLLAKKIDAPMLWGESAESAAVFYKKKGFGFFEEIFYIKKDNYQSFLTTNTERGTTP
jgi:hypothetical protein